MPAPPHPLASDALLDAWSPVVGSAGRRELATGEALERQLAQSWSGDQQPVSPGGDFLTTDVDAKWELGPTETADERLATVPGDDEAAAGEVMEPIAHEGRRAHER